MGDINIKGLDELQKLMDQLTPKLEANIMRGALRAGMKVVRDKAKLNIDSKTGGLSSSLRIYTRLRDGVVKSALAAKGFDGYVAMWVEFGTRPHLIKVDDAEKNINYRLSRKRGETVLESMTTINRRSLIINQKFVGPVIRHPGAKPKPFLRPALDSEGHRAVVAAAIYIKQRLTKKENLDASHIEIELEE